MHLPIPNANLALARLLNVSIKTVQSWEQGHRKPSQAALRMIQVFRHDPSGLLEVVGMSRPKVTASVGKPAGAVRKTSRS